jgi:hypothetical protein
LRYLLPVVLAAIALASLPARPPEGVEPVDCSNLLTILERVLESVVSGTPNPELVRAVASAPVPGDLGVRHRDAYGKLLRYLNYLERVGGGSLSPREARELAAELSILASELGSSVGGYGGSLARCSHDPALASTLSTRVRQLLDELVGVQVPSLVQLLLQQASRGLLEVWLDRGSYRAGDTAELVVRPLREGLEVVRAYVALWPTLTRVAEVTLVRRGSEYVGVFEVPNLTTLSRYYSPPVPATVALAAVVELLDTSDGSTYRGYALFSIEFGRPRVTVEAPATLYLGDVLEVVVRSDGYYRARVSLGGSYVVNATLVPGTNTFRFDTSLLNITYGTHIIRVEVEPTATSIGTVVTRPVVLLPRVPRVDVRLPTFLVTVDGYATVEVVSREVPRAGLRVVVYVGSAVRGPYYLNGSLRVRVLLGYLPVATAEVSVRVVADAPGYEPYVARWVVVYVNPATSIAVGVASVFATTLLYGREREFTVLVLSLGRRRVASAARVLRSALLEFTYRVSSRVAELYYSTLRRLRLPMPEPYETLREHFARLPLGRGVAELLRRLMLLAERDLYSRYRQDYGEALRVAEEVLRSGG